MNTKPVLLVAISYRTAPTFLLCFLTLLTVLGIAVAPASAQPPPLFSETSEADTPFTSGSSFFAPSPLVRDDAASATPDKRIPLPKERLTFRGSTILPHGLGVPVRTAPVRTAVILNFKSSIPESFWQALLFELGRPGISGSFDRPVLWTRYDRFPAGSDFPDVVQVRLRGKCHALDDDPNPPHAGPLGWTFLVSDEIQPFVLVDCDRVRYTLASALRNQPREARQQALARAISRVILHELTHIVTQSAAHSPAGIQKAYLTPADLTQSRVP